MAKDNLPKSKMGVRGFFRINIVDPNKDNEVVGDSGWCENVVTVTGLYNCFGGCGIKRGDSFQAGYLGLGTGAAPNYTATALPSATATIVTCATSNVATGVGAQTMQVSASFAGSDIGGAACTIQNIGLFKTNSNSSLCAGQTYATSQWSSDQNVNATYQIQLSTS
jgi:hypothetical protein